MTDEQNREELEALKQIVSLLIDSLPDGERSKVIDWLQAKVREDLKDGEANIKSRCYQRILWLTGGNEVVVEDPDVLQALGPQQSWMEE